MMRALIAVAVLLLAGCAGTQPRVVQSNLRSAVADAIASCATSVEKIATSTSGDAASKVAAVGALERLCGGQMHVAMQPAPQPQSLGATLWQAALQVTDIALRGYGMKVSRDVAVVNSNNNRDVALGSYSAFTAMGNAIATAGTAGYAYVQAPAANITNTTLSGTGVLGSGTYTGPVTTTTTTTRTCNGGEAGNGAGTTAGGAGGGAPGGTC